MSASPHSRAPHHSFALSSAAVPTATAATAISRLRRENWSMIKIRDDPGQLEVLSSRLATKSILQQKSRFRWGPLPVRRRRQGQTKNAQISSAGQERQVNQ